MSAPSSHLTTFFIFFLCTAVQIVTSLPPCPPCGSQPVPYPLSTRSDCGDPSYPILCNPSSPATPTTTTAGALFFPSLNNTYPITSITPSTQRLTISPAPFVPNTCIAEDFSSNGLQLNQSSPFNITSANTILFLNCSERLLGSPLNCSTNSLCHVYANHSSADGGRSCSGGICCAFRAGGSTTSYMIRLREEGCRAYRSFVNLDYGLPAGSWPSPAVEIQWVLPREPTCGGQGECGSGSTCRVDPIGNGGLRRCFCDAGLAWDGVNGVCAKPCRDPNGCKKDRTALIAGLSSGLGASLIASLIALVFYKRHRRAVEEQERIKREREEILNSGGGKTAKIFTGKDIKKATNNFAKDRLLGSGGYGEVYRGVLEDGTLVAVKCAKLGNTKGIDQVLNEVRILCQVNHKSLVRLLGCCVELEQPLLVYEYVPNGTLFDHLRGRGGTNNHCKGRLSWNERLDIARATAEGLAYLHSSAVPPIYHRDVKSSNILLDEKFNAKVSDFGLSRLAHTDMSHVSTCAQGTLGYLDPEYYRNYQLTDKSDVYSFGVVLLELLTSQKAIDFGRDQDDVNLAIYVQRLVEGEKLMDCVDPTLKTGRAKWRWRL